MGTITYCAQQTCCIPPSAKKEKDTKSSIYTESSYLGFSYKDGSPNAGFYGGSLNDTNLKKKGSESFSFSKCIPSSKNKRNLFNSSYKLPSSICECGNIIGGCNKCYGKDSFK